MTRELPLSQGKVALVDDRDHDRAMEFKWSAVQCSGLWYARRNIMQGGKSHLYYLHHFILGVPGTVRIDHQDHDGLNCTRENIRLATAAQNQYNTRPGRANTTGYKGVILLKNGLFQAQITTNGISKTFGTHDDIHFAAHVRDAAARHYQGEFAWTNFPEANPDADAFFRNWLEGKRLRRKTINSTLTPEQVAEIKQLLAAGVMQKEIAARYPVKPAAISHIKTGRSWK